MMIHRDDFLKLQTQHQVWESALKRIELKKSTIESQKAAKRNSIIQISKRLDHHKVYNRKAPVKPIKNSVR